MSYTTWKLNGELLEVLGLKDARLTYANLQPDTLEVRHLTARWDADPLFAYAESVVLTRVLMNEPYLGGSVISSTVVFRGKCRGFPRFLGRTAESLSYTFAGVWDELQRRPLLQNQAVVVDPEVSTIPTMVPQGLVILSQEDDGTSVNIAAALEVVINAAIAAGVSIELGTITGYDFAVGWDEIADLTIADAITRLLQVAPDAAVWIDYAPTVPVIHFSRRAELEAVTLPLSLVGVGEWPTYAGLDTLRIRSRPDLVVPFVSIQFRRLNTVNGQSYLTIEKQTAGAGTETDENALVRTIQLAGSSYSETILTQECKTLNLAGALGNGTLDDDVVTVASDPSAFAELSAFWKRKVPALATPGVVIQGFRNRIRKAAEIADDAGDPITPTLDTSLVRELIEGAITPWMRSSGLGRSAQEQNYEVEIAYDAPTVEDPLVVFRVTQAYTAPVMATNASTRTYNFQESSDVTDPETTPDGLADSLLTALENLQHEGEVAIIEQECSLNYRPGKVLGLTAGRDEWIHMGALIQSATCDLDSWRTSITFGWPTALGPADLVEIFRANRLRRPADRGLIRTTGTL
jgi:hypothetical protein